MSVQVKSPQLRQLIEILSFLEANQLSFKNLQKEDFSMNGNQLVIARPWMLENDPNGLRLKRDQRDVVSMIDSVNLLAAEKNCVTLIVQGIYH